MVQHYRNQGRGRVADGRRLEYGRENLEGNHEYENCLKEEKNLESLD